MYCNYSGSVMSTLKRRDCEGCLSGKSDCAFIMERFVNVIRQLKSDMTVLLHLAIRR
jgi:hypothetical protein